MRKPKGFHLAGHFAVDAGQCIIADPCYIIPADTDLVPKDWQSWHRMLESAGYFRNPLGCHQVTPPNGQLEVGVVVSTGAGDGVYPVYVKHETDGPWRGYVKEVRILFL